jgi:hypothetical protein
MFASSVGERAEHDQDRRTGLFSFEVSQRLKQHNPAPQAIWPNFSRLRDELKATNQAVKRIGVEASRRVEKSTGLEAGAKDHLKAKAEAKTTGDVRGKAIEPHRAQKQAMAQRGATQRAAQTDRPGARSKMPPRRMRQERKAPRPPRAFKKVVMRRQFDGYEQLTSAREKLCV